ncbi:MAG: molybdenum ABC transporter ATP-binding protein, partial [Proteobacteria bacterium]|nr:molybdenum ABC transporter ATP-binding protein [Pseudomonadota bacterium]
MSIAARFTHAYPGFVLDVDLSLPERGVTALFGPSGAGKTTLLRIIAGLERTADGHLQVNGETWQSGADFLPPHRRSLGYVFQEASLFPHLSVRGNLEYGMRRIAGSARKVAADRTIELLGLGSLLQRRPDRLSGGERQRVAIARALLTSPHLLLMDEPLAALDLPRKLEILPYLERLFKELDIPVIYVSHSPDEVARLADYLVVMDGGRAVAAGPLADTLARLDLPIRLGEEAGVVLAGVVAEHDRQWHLARITAIEGDFWVRDAEHPLGHAVRMRILARDVSIALQRN